MSNDEIIDKLNDQYIEQFNKLFIAELKKHGFQIIENDILSLLKPDFQDANIITKWNGKRVEIMLSHSGRTLSTNGLSFSVRSVELLAKQLKKIHKL